MAKAPENEIYSEQETERRREAALKRMLATPPKPQKPPLAKAPAKAKRLKSRQPGGG